MTSNVEKTPHGTRVFKTRVPPFYFPSSSPSPARSPTQRLFVLLRHYRSEDLFGERRSEEVELGKKKKKKHGMEERRTGEEEEARAGGEKRKKRRRTGVGKVNGGTRVLKT